MQNGKVVLTLGKQDVIQDFLSWRPHPEGIVLEYEEIFNSRNQNIRKIVLILKSGVKVNLYQTKSLNQYHKLDWDIDYKGRLIVKEKNYLILYDKNKKIILYEYEDDVEKAAFYPQGLIIEKDNKLIRHSKEEKIILYEGVEDYIKIHDWAVYNKDLFVVIKIYDYKKDPWDPVEYQILLNGKILHKNDCSINTDDWSPYKKGVFMRRYGDEIFLKTEKQKKLLYKAAEHAKYRNRFVCENDPAAYFYHFDLRFRSCPKGLILSRKLEKKCNECETKSRDANESSCPKCNEWCEWISFNV